MVLKTKIEKLRILYAPGPGNVIGTYKHWAAGRDDPSQVCITYSSQFYEVCRELDVEALVIAPTTTEEKCLHDGKFILKHHAIPFPSLSGFAYHLSQFLYELRLIFSAIRFGTTVAVVGNGRTHWFMLSILSGLGVKVIPSLHCVLWCKYAPKSRSNELILNLSKSFFSRNCFASLVASEDIAVQIKDLTGESHCPLVQFLPSYRREEFSDIAPPNVSQTCFRVLFAGRIEENKGVFDLLEIAKHLVCAGEKGIVFDICGSGSMLQQLRDASTESNVSSIFYCHGHCTKPKMHQMFSQSHVVIVPTRTDFVEGFNQVVVEGILAGRPVITSSVCPSINHVKEAVLEVPPNDVDAYYKAILSLYGDRDLYETKRRNCLLLQNQFYNPENSWGALLKMVLTAIGDGKETLN